jgi:hypothetical protein
MAAATRVFDPREFVTVRDVPVFVEHQTKTNKGRSLKFTERELAAVARKCNERIKQTGDYAALVLGHTPTPSEISAGKPMPPLVGFAGPFRMGTFGDKAAIMADFHYYKEDADLIRRFPRRSPELMLAPEYEQMFLDPIALLGAEPPRLNMGLLYSAYQGGREVQRYTAVFPGAGNVYIPGGSGDRKTRYGAAPVSASNLQQLSEVLPMLSPEELDQIVEAVSKTDWAMYVKDQMAKSGAADGQLDEPPADLPLADDEPPVVPAEPEPAAPAADDLPAPIDDEPAVPADEDDDKKENYAALRREVIELKRQVVSQREALDTERGQRVDAERYSQLAVLGSRFALDLDEEAEACRYGRMSDDQFNEHLDRIQRHYRPSMAHTRIPTLDTPRGSAKVPATGDSKKYSKAQSDKAREFCERKAAAGERVDYASVLERVKSGQPLD